LYIRELNNLISKKRVPRYLMLFGESLYFIEEYSKRLIELYSAEDITIFHSFNYDFESAKEAVSGNSLFSESSMLIIKSDDKISNSELKELIRRVEKSETSYFLFLYYGDNFKDNQKTFGDNFVRFFSPNFTEIENIVNLEVSKRGFQIEPEGINYLIHLKNSNISMIISEIEKLSNYDKAVISKKDIVETVVASNEVELDQVIDYFFRSRDFVKLLQFIDKFGSDEISVITYMIRFVGDIYLFRSNIELRLPSDSLSILGYRLPPQIEAKKRETSMRFNFNQISKILHILMETELRLKSGKFGDKNSLLSEKLLKISKEI
jgi:DNA polymerase III delta subunit